MQISFCIFCKHHPPFLFYLFLLNFQNSSIYPMKFIRIFISTFIFSFHLMINILIYRLQLRLALINLQLNFILFRFQFNNFLKNELFNSYLFCKHFLSLRVLSKIFHFLSRPIYFSVVRQSFMTLFNNI